MSQLYFEDLNIGDRFFSPSVTITDSHFMFFKGLTGDNHPIHYDDHYAKQTKFQKRVAHGLLVTAMGAMGATNLSPRLEESLIAFLEQGSTFLAPVFIGDTVQSFLTVKEKTDKGKYGIVELALNIYGADGICVVEGFHKYMIKKGDVAGK
jgi:acyl dehydratase